MKIRKEVKIGFVIIVAIGLLIWGLNFLKGNDVFRKQRYFYAIYDRVEGLVPANPVNINGLKVGQVSDLSFVSDSSATIIVKFIISSDIRIPSNTIARIYSEDLMGSKAIALKLGDSREMAQPGDTLITDIESSLMEEVNKQVQPLKRKAENLIMSIDSMVTVIQYVFNEEMRSDLTKSVASISQTIRNLERTSYRIDTIVLTQEYKLAAIMSHIESITRNLKDNNENISRILTNFSTISDSLAKAEISETLLAANKALNNVSSVLTKIESGEGTLGMLVNDDSLYMSLSGAATELNMLVEDIKLNPGRYVRFSVFGRSDKNNPYVSPEEREKMEKEEEENKKSRKNRRK